ncbi:MAG: hydrogenase expression/formation protein HypE [Oscillospiraceae bacterium]|nr:hydrogenase expression/formation protein HypE [Oscillospiraceae bacterium]
MNDIITLDYGSGGKKTAKLIEELILPKLDNPALRALGDGAVVPGGEELAFSTDSFVVDPLFFPGGNIGKLAVCGTVNDLSMCGAEPKYLSCALILEEGLELSVLEAVLQAMSEAAEKAGVRIVTGDTKVVEKGRGDKLYINTAGIGVMRHPLPGLAAVQPGDAVLVSGTMGDHGTTVMLARSGMMEGTLQSDCAALNRLTEAMLSSGAEVRILRDPTRGGLATTLNEFTERQRFGITLEEESIPVRPEVQAACGMLGLDPLYCANEGKLIAICAAEDAETLLRCMRELPEGKDAARIGTVTAEAAGKTVLCTALGGHRILQKLAGAQLPRIC